jgi:MFS transporter, DHA2 family, multidrug resistance protein
VVVAPIIGPVLGGWLTDSYDWRWIFLINVPVGIVLFLLIGALLPKSDADGGSSTTGRKIDAWGFALVALTLGCLQIVFDRGDNSDWFASGFITALAIVAAASFVLLIWRELRHEDPVVDLRLFANREFGAAVGMMGVLGFTLFASTFLLPSYAQGLMGYTAVDAGLVIAPGGLCLIVLMPLVGRMVNQVDVRLLLSIGFIGSALASWWMTHFYLGVSFEMMMFARMAQMASLAFVFIPINTVIFRSVPPNKTNNASALVNLARNFGGSVGLAFASTLLTRREQFHQSRIVEQLQPMNPAYPDYVGQAAQLTGGAADPSSTLANLYQEAVQQATLLGYLDDFKALALVFVVCLLLLLFVKAGKGGGSAVIPH